MPHTDRRLFLQQTAGLAAGLYLAAGATAAETEPQPLRVGLMGCGGRGRPLSVSFAKQPGVTIATVCDPDSERLTTVVDELEKQTGTKPQMEKDVRRMLDDQSIDILIVAAPNHWHGPATILGCAAGKHVYVEKPCCHNPAEGEMMLAAARKHGRCVQVGTQRRSNPAIQEGISLVLDGEIGDPYYARCWYSNQRDSIGQTETSDPPAGLDYELWQGPAPRKPFHSNYLHYSWHWFWHWGNGELGNNGTHAIDLGRAALGVDFPISVASSGGRYAYQDDQQTPDTHIVSYKFPGEKQIAWEGLSCNRMGINGRGFGVTIHGNDGTLEILSDGYILFDSRGKELKQNSSTGPGDAQHIANFLASIRANDPTQLNCGIETGYKSTLLPLLGNIAHRVGRELTCSAETGRPEGQDAMAFWTREYAPGWEPVV